MFILGNPDNDDPNERTTGGYIIVTAETLYIEKIVFAVLSTKLNFYTYNFFFLDVDENYPDKAPALQVYLYIIIDMQFLFYIILF